MIQRIQSIYLLAASMMLFFLLNSPLAEIITVDENLLSLNYLSLEAVSGQGFEKISVWPLTALIFSVMGLGLITIFMYKKRTTQMRICMFNILLMFGLIAMVYYYTKLAPLGVERAKSVMLWPIVVPFVSVILTYLALKAIQKDDALVKSHERLR